MDWHQFYDKQEETVPLLPGVAEWQVELADRILAYSPRFVVECGSGAGQTSCLLAETIGKVMLVDLVDRPLRQASQYFSQQGREGIFFQGDLFDLPFKEATVDVAFNAGVFEHFNFKQRCSALQEMARIIRPGGVIVVAVPNHFSTPYRYAYNYLKQRNRWPYPDEVAMYDLVEEAHAIGLQVEQKRETVSREEALYFLRRHQRFMFRVFGLWRSYEGYLTILTLRKGDGQ